MISHGIENLLMTKDFRTNEMQTYLETNGLPSMQKQHVIQSDSPTFGLVARKSKPLNKLGLYQCV